MQNKQIILNADDYGACAFINDGITEAVRIGKINSVSCFVTHESSKKDILELIDLKQKYKFEVGLHFSITSGHPITTCSSMKAGPGKPFYLVHEHNYLNINLDELRTELRNQINQLQAFLDSKSAGKVDHITVHHGVIYFFDRLFNVLKEVAEQNDIPIRSPMPWSKSDFKFYDYDQPRNIYDLAIPIKIEGIRNGAAIFWNNVQRGKFRDKALLKMLRGQGKDNIERQIKTLSGKVRFPICYADTIYGQPFLENIIYLISQVPDSKTVEFMFHLGSGNELVNAPHGINRDYFKHRKLELAALRHLDFRQILSDYKIITANYSEL